MASSQKAVGNGSNEILVEGNTHVKVVILNRPQKFNAITYEMELQLLKLYRAFKKDPKVKLIILKGNGRVFSAGGDVVKSVNYTRNGHWTFAAHAYKKKIQLVYAVATYRKCQVALINGLNVGLGAGLCISGKFRVVTENAAFAMPEAALGFFPDIGASYFLSRLPGFMGEYIGLTSTRLDGADMLSCGLATHFILSKKLPLLEEALYEVDTEDPTVVSTVINRYTQPPLKKDSVSQRMDLINKCFSKESVEEILDSLEQETINDKNEWIIAAIKSIKQASPTHIKVALRSIREGRNQDISTCLVREYRLACHVLRQTVCSDFYEGVRAKLVDKDNKPKWEPSKLELVSQDILDVYFTKMNEDDVWDDLKLPSVPNLPKSPTAKL